ncbi:MAG: dihydrolipoyl dehydrogenase [Nitrososphaeria archaeon]
MKHYDVIAFGTGSAMNIVSELLGHNPRIRVAVIENAPVGGICLTRGCIPSKMILYPAEIMSHIKRAGDFWIDVEVRGIDFAKIMEWAQGEVMGESRMIEENIRRDPRIDLYRTTGEFVGDYTVKVGDEVITGDKILLCTGSRPLVPDIPGLEEAGYVTNENFFSMRKLPRRVAVIGGSYIGLEFGFFLSMMGSHVTIFDMLPRIAPGEEPEVSYLLELDMSSHMDVVPGHRVVEVRRRGEAKVVAAEGTEDHDSIEVEVDEIVVAAGRRSNSDLTKPEKTGVKTDANGWIVVNEYLETTKPNIWACGDALGRHMFKHVANYESQVVYYNAFRGQRVKADYHAVPHAIFVQPEVAAVGAREEDLRGKGGDYLVGYYMYKDTAKGLAMKDEHHFAKVIVEEGSERLLGSHIIGPYASSMIHEAIVLMNTRDQSLIPAYRSMHVHPAVNEVLERAMFSLAPPDAWEDLKEHLREHAMEVRERTLRRLSSGKG